MIEARKLAAVLVADIAGFSRLASRDEDRTLARIRALRSDLVDPTIAVHRGRVVKGTGDGVISEFRSVVDAVRCAIELQSGMIERNSGLPAERRIELRIGIHIGDVVEEADGDLMGDSVNIAARLEGIAEPGAICLSEDAYRQVRARLDLSVSDLGEKALKNIAEPMRVYAVEVGAPAVRGPTASTGPALAPSAPPAKPSIAVLPFHNMSGDAEQELFTDGLTEDIITDLSNVRGFFVIARNSTFAYKGKPTDVRQVARDLGVKYVLEGSARRSNKRLRVNVQLIDAAEGGNHIWAERFDREIADIFEVQDDVTRRVVEAITGKLVFGPIVERRRPTNIEAYDLCVSSRLLNVQSKSGNLEARALLERAIALEPDYCEAHWRLADNLAASWLVWSEPQEPNRGRALVHARRAVSVDPKDSNAHAMLGAVLSYERRWDESEAHFETAIRLNPNDAESLTRFSDFMFLSGKPQEAIDCVTRAFRLNPHAPGFYYWYLGQAQVAAGKYEEAVSTLRHEETYRTTSRRDLCAALVKLGRFPEAREEAKLFILSSPDWRISTTFEGEAVFKNPADKQFWVEAYRAAGLPE